MLFDKIKSAVSLQLLFSSQGGNKLSLVYTGSFCCNGRHCCPLRQKYHGFAIILLSLLVM